MNPVATIAVILICGLWFIVASAFLIWTIFGLVGALRDSALFDRKESTPNRRERRRRTP